jgi:hypothetical protein
MDIATLLKPGGSWLHLFIGTESDADDLWHSWINEHTVVRQVRGHKMHTTHALFDEFAAAWQFPWYFGGNWDALEECLADLSWLPAKTYVLGIRRAADILQSDSAEQRRVFWTLLGNIAREKTVRVVLQCTSQDEASLRKALTAAGVSL